MSKEEKQSLLANGAEECVVIGVSGISRSGKGWVSKGLLQAIQAMGKKATIIAQDDFWYQACQVKVRGQSRTSEEEPECFTHEAFVASIKDNTNTHDVVIAEGFQLVYSPQVTAVLNNVFLIEIDRAEARRRRTQPRDAKLNPNPLEPEDFDDLLWPAHERYMKDKVAPLGARVVKLRGPANSEQRDELVHRIMRAAGLVKDIAVVEDAPTRKPSAKVDKPPAVRKQLHHITGVKTLLTMWIVIHHMSPMKPTTGISIFTMRVDVAVELFVMTSGFMTQYAYGTKDVTSSAGSLIAFYVQRLARISVSAQLAMCFCLFFSWFGGDEIFTGRNFGCLLFVKNWLNPDPNCPDSPTWFVAAMIPSWLLWPLITRPVLTGRSFNGLLQLSLIIWLVALGPPLALCLMQGDWLTWHQVKYTWFWPPSQLGDFALGSAVAALLAKREPPKNAAHVADIMALIVIGFCLFYPIIDPTPGSWTGPMFRPGHFLGLDGLSGRLAAPLLAIWIYCSSAGGYSARFLSHPVLKEPGVYTLEVYLFQSPLHDLFMWIKGGLDLPSESTEVFMLYLFLLWIISVMFVDFIAVPADKWLRSKTKDWPDKPLGYFFGSSRSYDSLPTSSVAPL